MTDLVERVARAIRRNKFERTGRERCFDETLKLTDGEMSEALAAMRVVLEEAARASVKAINQCREDGESDLRSARQAVIDAILDLV